MYTTLWGFKAMIYLFILHGPRLIISVLRNVGKCLISCMYNTVDPMYTHLQTQTQSWDPCQFPEEELSLWWTHSHKEAAGALDAFRYLRSINTLTRSLQSHFNFFSTERWTKQMGQESERLLVVLASLVIERPNYLNFVQNREKWG